MNVRSSLVAVALLATVVLTGCRGGADGADDDPSETATTATPTVSATPSPTEVIPTAATATPATPKPKTLPTAGRKCAVLEEPLRPFPGHTLSIANRGAHLQEVRELQSMINGAGDGHDCIPEDGDFGPVTRAAVAAFQEAYELTGYGVVGEDTWNRLNLVLSH